MYNKFTPDFVYTHYNLASCMGYTNTTNIIQRLYAEHNFP